MKKGKPMSVPNFNHNFFEKLHKILNKPTLEYLRI